MIRVTCECGVTLRAPARLLGKAVKCPKCAAVVRVEEPEPEIVIVPPAPTRSARDYAYLGLLAAFLPLAWFLLGTPDDAAERFEKTIEANPKIVETLEKRLEAGAKMDIDDIVAAMPGHKIQGAHLPVGALAHWIYALVAAAAFFGVLMVIFPRDSASWQHLLFAGLFTGTVGILFLFAVQWIAAWTSGYYMVGKGVITLLFYVAKFIAFSYQAAMDPENGFVLSMFGYTFGVGLCEELVKALPLIWIFRGASAPGWRGAVLVGLATGVGFGVAEGVIYSMDFYNGIATGGIYVVRFVSCVALHAVWSAAVGAALYARQGDIQGPMGFFDYAFPMLRFMIVPMLLHGLYDTLLKRDLGGWALVVALISFGWLAFLIERARGTHEPSPEPSPA